MQGLPANGRPETVYTYAIVLVIFGLLKSWVSLSQLCWPDKSCYDCCLSQRTVLSYMLCSKLRANWPSQTLALLHSPSWDCCPQAGPCCNNPVFAEIVPPNMRNMVYAFDRCAL